MICNGFIHIFDKIYKYVFKNNSKNIERFMHFLINGLSRCQLHLYKTSLYFSVTSSSTFLYIEPQNCS